MKATIFTVSWFALPSELICLYSEVEACDCKVIVAQARSKFLVIDPLFLLVSSIALASSFTGY